MRLIDADKFLEYLIFSKHIDELTCKEVKEAVEMCKVDVLEQIRAEISAILTNSYDEGVKEKALLIIDKYREEQTDAT